LNKATFEAQQVAAAANYAGLSVEIPPADLVPVITSFGFCFRNISRK